MIVEYYALFVNAHTIVNKNKTDCNWYFVSYQRYTDLQTAIIFILCRYTHYQLHSIYEFRYNDLFIT